MVSSAALFHGHSSIRDAHTRRLSSYSFRASIGRTGPLEKWPAFLSLRRLTFGLTLRMNMARVWRLQPCVRQTPSLLLDTSKDFFFFFFGLKLVHSIEPTCLSLLNSWAYRHVPLDSSREELRFWILAVRKPSHFPTLTTFSAFSVLLKIESERNEWRKNGGK